MQYVYNFQKPLKLVRASVLAQPNFTSGLNPALLQAVVNSFNRDFKKSS